MKFPSLNFTSWLPANEIAVDLGTANTLVYVKGEGIVLNEPSVVAIEKATGKIKGIGLEAKRMLGRTPDGILAVRPLKDGVIADFDVTEKMLRYFLKTIIDKHVFRVKPKVIVCVPSGITEVERRAVRDSAETAGAKQVLMVAEPMAAAIGVGLPVETPTGNMVIDIGGGTTEIAVIALSGIVSDTSIRTGGDELDQAIVQFMRKNYNLLVGEPTAETIKIKIGSAAPTGDEREMEVKGRDLVSGIPKTVRVHSDRDPRGGAGADPADRRRGAARARDHAARARQRHRGSRHRDDRRRRPHPRPRHPAGAGDRPPDPRGRGSAHLRGPGHGPHSRRLREIPQRPLGLSMSSASERSYTRRDTVMFLVCLGRLADRAVLAGPPGAGGLRGAPRHGPRPPGVAPGTGRGGPHRPGPPPRRHRPA